MREEIVNIIKTAYPENKFDEGRNYSVWQEFPSPETIEDIVNKIQSLCQVNVYSYTDENYDCCYWIEISISKDYLTFHQRGLTHEKEREYLKKIGGQLYEMLLQISMLGPYAVITWHESSLKNDCIKLYKNPPSSECIKFQNQIVKILKEYKIEVLSWEELNEPVEWMKPGGLTGIFDTEPIPTVYNCLFSEF